MLKFVRIKTETGETDPQFKYRHVNLAYDGEEVWLMGALKHNTIIVVNQELVDDLQALVNEIENHVG
jgi:hypothetical protein